MSEKIYTHPTKGGYYRQLGAARGAGSRKGDGVIVYQCIKTGAMYFREPEDFAFRLKVKELGHA